jgi:hypothetical protein
MPAPIERGKISGRDKGKPATLIVANILKRERHRQAPIAAHVIYRREAAIKKTCGLANVATTHPPARRTNLI